MLAQSQFTMPFSLRFFVTVSLNCPTFLKRVLLSDIFYASYIKTILALHYAKRLYETQFVHRFSNGTMPLTNLFKNCSYYWGFAAFMSYFVNHPLYTPPALGMHFQTLQSFSNHFLGSFQVYLGLAGFLVCEMGLLHLNFTPN